MTKADRDPGRGQLHRRGARVWRDEANPTGPGQAKDQPEVESDATEAPAGQAPAEAPEEPTDERSTTNAGPGAGGATEWSGRAKHHEGLHGGPSRKP